MSTACRGAGGPAGAGEVRKGGEKRPPGPPSMLLLRELFSIMLDFISLVIRRNSDVPCCIWTCSMYGWGM